MKWTKTYNDQLWNRTFKRGYRYEELSAKIKNGVTIPNASSLKLGEAKSITAAVLFVDIVSFTERSERTTHNDLLLILDIFLAEMTEIVNDWGGTIEKFTGDGLMAIFDSTQITTSQMVKNVIDAATTMAYAISGPINKYLETKGLEPIHFRIGIDAGEILVGKLGVRSDNDLIAIGWAANIASKLCDIASVDSIFIGNYMFPNLPQWEQLYCLRQDVVDGWNYIIKGTALKYPFYKYTGRWKIPS